MYRRHEQFDREQDRRYGKEEQSFCGVARPTRIWRSLSQMDVFGFRVLCFDRLLSFLQARSRLTVVDEFARASTKFSGGRYSTWPNQALQTTPKLAPFLLFLTRQYGVSDL